MRLQPIKLSGLDGIGIGLSKRQRKQASEAAAQVHLYWQKTLLVVFTIVVLSVVMSVHLMPDKVSLHLGDISPRELTAQRSVIYLNSVATAQTRQAARLSTAPAYDPDDRAANNAAGIVKDLFDQLDRAHALLSTPSADPTRRESALRTLQTDFGQTLTAGQIRNAAALSPAVLRRLRDTSTHLISDAMERDIKDQSDVGEPATDLKHARQDVADEARTTLASDAEVQVVQAVAYKALQPNRLLNRRRTEAVREAAAREIAPVYGRIVRGDTIINLGDRVTQEHLDKFQGLGMLDPRMEIQTGAAICILAAVMVLTVSAYIRRNMPGLYGDMRRLSLLSFIVLLSVVGLKVGATMLGLQFNGGQFGYLAMMSAAAAGMLVSVLIDNTLAVLVVSLLAVLSGLIMNHEIRFTVMTLMSSLAGIASCRSVRNRTNLLTTSLVLSSANLGLVWLMGLLFRDSLPELFTASCWAVLMGFAATTIYWFGILAFEKPFGILTHQALLDLSAPDKPLLQQLCAIAPGTYAHSIMVGTLAEAGARAIGADSLLCRVAGYYHDIGKMKRPEFFVENQRNGNVHGRLSPSLSAVFITAHVKDGLEMAKENKLPQEIRDIIASHHGTTLIGYFYHQALTDCGGSDEAPPGLEERFRYPGPRPTTREAAVVMLADSVEAATRCIERPRRDKLEAEIARIVRGKIEDGQFDDCSITFKDIKGITDAFVHVLEAMMHGRVNYPKLSVQAEPGTRAEQAQSVPQPEILEGGIQQALPAPDEFPFQLEFGLEEQHTTDGVFAARLATDDRTDSDGPEELYASPRDERTGDAGQHSEAAAGRQSIAQGRKSVSGGS